MLIYHPGYDVNHCCYRILNILFNVDDNQLNHDLLKLFDFYYLYPHLLKKISRLPKPLCYEKKLISAIEEPFEITPNSKSLFFEMSILQEDAINSLINKGLITIKGKLILLSIDNVPPTLVQKFRDGVFSSSHIHQMLLKNLPKVTLNGLNGIKAKSGLMEYRYD